MRRVTREVSTSGSTRNPGPSLSLLGKNSSLKSPVQGDSLCKPDIVLYGENLDETVINQSFAAIHAADWMLIVGTSAAVYPAAQLPIEFKNNGGIMSSWQQKLDYVLSED